MMSVLCAHHRKSVQYATKVHWPHQHRPWLADGWLCCTAGCCACRYMSAVEFSHTTLVADLTWLPGIEIDRQGKVYPIRCVTFGGGGRRGRRREAVGEVWPVCVRGGAPAAGSPAPPPPYLPCPGRHVRSKWL
jgi:hypothetical protein